MGNCFGSEPEKKYAAEEQPASGGDRPSAKRVSTQKVDATTAAGMNELAKKSALLRVSATPDKLAKTSGKATDMMSAINDEWHERKDNNGVLPESAAPTTAAPATAAAAPAPAATSSTSTAVADASKAVTAAANNVASAANTVASDVSKAVAGATTPATTAAAPK